MAIVISASITLVIFYILFRLFKRSKMKEGERMQQNEADRQVKETQIRSQQNLHEKEKKRWEDEYWKRQAKGER